MWVSVALGPETQGPDNPPLHPGPLHPVSKFVKIILLGAHHYDLKTEEDLIKIQTTDILASELGEVMDAMLMHDTYCCVM